MGAQHRQHVTRGQRDQVPLAAFRARLVQDAADGEPVHIRYTDGLDRGALSTTVNAWPARADGDLPTAGDDCLVVLDDARRPWIVAWDQPGF